MALHDDVAKMHAKRGGVVPEALQGVTKEKIRTVMAFLDLGKNTDLIDCIFAMLDDETENWFSKAPKGATISDGASTGHLACHIGLDSSFKCNTHGP